LRKKLSSQIYHVLKGTVNRLALLFHSFTLLPRP